MIHSHALFASDKLGHYEVLSLLGQVGALSDVVDSSLMNSPEEARKFDKGKVGLVNVAGATIGRATFEPGWKWSTCVKPIAKTNSCQAAHRAAQQAFPSHDRQGVGCANFCNLALN